ncbi:MAG: peroxiredoxin [Gammaproteobacteria bacterium]
MRNVLVALTAVAVTLAAGPAAASPAVGDPAPGFQLLDQKGEAHRLEDYAGKWVVMYFYPKADTPGCTTEACAFRDNIFAFREMGAEIVGISLDVVSSQQEFAEKYSLPFTLLSDAEGEVAESYGVLRNLGVMKMAKRETFIIAPDGTIARHYDDVDPDEHSAEVLADLKTLVPAG